MTRDGESPENEHKSAVIDWNVLGALEELRKPGEPDMRSMLIKVYLKSSVGLINQIKTAIGKSDGPSLASAAHSLKSASVHMGATRLGVLCGELDRIGRSGVLSEAVDLVRRAEEQYAAVVTALEKALPHLTE